ncbi:hypothetical protein [Aquimarina algicola]|uniref:Uncharacterized protein n=1 Tax=Aquimarina algicola TaxID=2589995 RepID=A0A504JA28_9FLAO|nr:hypothetical protein [Aquimarina algicola]TPN85382.1 hypothetical protein FHK87_15315 [Aquimarina algicola]
MKIIKPNFTISTIGKFRFYSGIFVGIGYGIIFNTLLRLVLKLCNLGDIITDISWSSTLNFKTSTYNLTLIGCASLAFSFCFTTYMWLSKPFASHRRKTLKLRMGQVNPIWILFGVLLFLLRMFWFFTGVALTIEKDYTYLGFMIPIFIYLFCWNVISDIYKSKKAFLISLPICIIIAGILSSI